MKSLCRRCHYLNLDFITGEHAGGDWFCGLHGRSRVDPDGEQQDLNHRGGCGFIPRTDSGQLSLII